MLLTGAGLVLRSFANLLAVDPGFKTAHVLTLDIEVPADRYEPIEARQAFYRRAFEAIGHLPGVEDAGMAAVTPLTGNNWTIGFERAGTPRGARRATAGCGLAERQRRILSSAADSASGRASVLQPGQPVQQAGRDRQ